MSSTRIVCCNGASVLGQRYIQNAGVAMGWAKNKPDAAGQQASILKKMLQKVGTTIMEYEQMNNLYFNNATFIQSDLSGYAKKLGLARIADLKGSEEFNNAIVVCSNNETVIGATYIRRAAKAYGLVTGKVPQLKNTWKKLKQTAGEEIKEYPKRDSAYYSNALNIKLDLSQCAATIASKNLSDLSSHDVRMSRISCVNGEDIGGESYLYQAALALGLAENRDQARSKFIKTLDKLKEIAEGVRDTNS